MPLVLPDRAGAPNTVVLGRPDLSISRLTEYRFEVLDSDEMYLADLPNVQPGGSLTWQATAAIKGGGSITVNDIGEEVDWLAVRIRPVVVITDVMTGSSAEYPVGIFIPAAPVEDWQATGRSWKIELLDKLSILDQDIPTDPLGQPTTFTAEEGANVVATVKALIANTGEKVDSIAASDKTLPVALTWDMGTTILKIVNDMLEAAAFLSLWCDEFGQFQVTPYTPPSQRAPVYALQGLFSKGEMSMMVPDWGRDRDIYSIPNRYVVVGQGDAYNEAEVATSTNTDPASPFSYAARGRWITTVETGVEAASFEDLQLYADKKLTAAVSVTSVITAKHLLLPDLRVNRTVQFTNPDADIDASFVVTSTTLPFDAVALCATTLEEVTL